MKTIRIYVVYYSGGKVTNKVADYHHGDKIAHVAAVSIRQAYYLAGNYVWASPANVTGIVEMMVDSECDLQWLQLDRVTRTRGSKYVYNQQCRREIEKYIDKMVADDREIE